MTSLLLPACVAWCVVTVGALACDGDRENCPAEAPKAAPADSARFKPPAFTPFTMPLPTLEEFESYVYVESVFSAEECKTIRRMGRSAKLQPGGVVDGQGKNIRQTNVSWLFTDKQVLPTLAADRPSADWIFGRLAAAVASANERHWKMDLSGFLEPLQFTQYQAPSAHYDFHRDSGRGRFSLRKVSLVVLLSKPSEFEGGDLELVDGKGGYTRERQACRRGPCVLMLILRCPLPAAQCPRSRAA